MAECTDCDSSGWRRVTTKYAEHQANTKHPAPEDRERTDAEQRLWRSAYETARNTVYPCKTCQPSVFWRWANGHFDPQHDRAACPECTTPKGAKRSQRAIDRPPPPPEPPPAYDDLETRT